MNVKVLSYNVHWGLSAFKRIDVSKSLSTFIHASEADIILLQELWLPTGALDYIMVETLREVWPHQICVATALLPEGEQGNGILSRYKIISWQQVDMSYTIRQSRSFLHARLALDDGKIISLICTHLGLSRMERMYQAALIKDYIEKKIPKDEALILGGDFNDWRGEMTKYFRSQLGLQEVFKDRTGRHAKSFPAIYPLLALDRMYVRGVVIEDAEVLRREDWRGSSDHLPLAARLSL